MFKLLVDQIFQMDVHDIVERISTWELDSSNIFINGYMIWSEKKKLYSFFSADIYWSLATQQAQLATFQFLYLWGEWSGLNDS